MKAANSRNGIEVADIFAQHIGQYRARYKMPVSHLKVASAILNAVISAGPKPTPTTHAATGIVPSANV